MKIPEKFTAGDTIAWQDTSARDPLGNAITSTDWTLTYYIRGNSALTVTAIANGPGWQTTISAAQSAALVAGNYYWQATASRGSERVTLGTGTVTVVENLAYTGHPSSYDGRSAAEQALSSIQAEIQARLTGGTAEEYSIGGRSLKKTPMRDLVAMESRYKTIVARERQAQKIAQGLGNPRSKYVMFR